ncbi:unnamed protein product [Moneuplotes crassus]|uniref:Uncharacterized protein n=1 Tax=Euplotes crassus TaxID=5936 RepID=A0AAD1UBB3_EUPCR|nr:unnamed protein product [Moneuplotes crassus]
MSLKGNCIRHSESLEFILPSLITETIPSHSFSLNLSCILDTLARNYPFVIEVGSKSRI